MSAKEQKHSESKVSLKRRSTKPLINDLEVEAKQQLHPATIMAGAGPNLSSLNADSMLQVQRMVGNIAVSRILDSVTPHGFQGLGSSDDLVVPGPMYVKDVTLDKLDGFPRVLGVSTPSMNNTYPSVVLKPELDSKLDEGFSFSPTEADEVAHSSIVAQQGRHALGETFLMNGDKFVGVSYGKFLWTLHDLRVACSVNGNYKLYYDINESLHQGIVAREQEHLDDFSYAFQISAKRVASEINQLAQKVYPGKVQAIEALIQALPIQLVPQEPMILDNWTSHLKSVFAQLADLSKERDSSGDHTPLGYKVECNSDKMEATLQPILRSVHRPTNEIVNLSKIKPVYDAHQLVDLDTIPVPDPGTEVTVQKQEKTKVYSAPQEVKSSKDFNGDTATIPPGTKCTVEKVGEQGKVWVKVTRQQCEIDKDYWDMIPHLQYIYFLIARNNLSKV